MIKINRFLTLVLLFFLAWACTKNNWDNLHDELSDVLPEAWKPQDVILENVSVTKCRLTWQYSGSVIDGFGIDRKEADGVWHVAYARVAPDIREWIDTAVIPKAANIIDYRIYCLAGRNKSAFSEVSAYTSIPSPTGLLVVKTDDLHYALSWYDMANGENGYRISRKINNEPWDENFATLGADSQHFVDSTIFYAKSVINVEYKVVAFYDQYASLPALVNTYAALTAPTNLTIELTDEVTTKLTWTDNSTGEEGFSVEKKEATGAWTLLAHTGETQFYDHEFKPGVTTTYRVSASIADYHSDFVENTYYFLLMVPTSFSCTRLNVSTVRLDWSDASTGEEGHVIEQNNGDGIWHLVAKVIGTTYSHQLTSYNNSVTFRICAYKLMMTSPYHEVVCNTEIPAPVALAGQYIMSQKKIVLQWQINTSGHDGFFIDRKNDTAAWENGYAQVNATTTTFTDAISHNTVYRYRVRTFFGEYFSAFSSVATMETFPFGIKLVNVQGGSFHMGCTSGQTNCESDETPVRLVTLSSYRICQTEITQKQWFEVMGTNPSNFLGCDSCPLENVSWNQIVSFRYTLNQATGLSYSLPTEAQWEYAARGGVNAGNTAYAGSNSIGAVAWMSANCQKPQPVGQKMPNELGLFDMSGNVMEWCFDRYGTYPIANQTNPTGALTGDNRVYRGGSWMTPEVNCRVADRNNKAEGSCNNQIGFRLVLSN